MTFTIPGLIIGILAGGLVTGLIAFVWPVKSLRWLRPLAASALGVGVALLIMLLVK